MLRLTAPYNVQLQQECGREASAVTEGGHQSPNLPRTNCSHVEGERCGHYQLYVHERGDDDAHRQVALDEHSPQVQGHCTVEL